jgi:hypothetical protein
VQLQEFITETITQITNGIVEAQEKLADTWVRINPKPPKGATAAGSMIYTTESGAGVFPLTFDVAVTADEKEGNVGVGIKVVSVHPIEMS